MITVLSNPNKRINYCPFARSLIAKLNPPRPIPLEPRHKPRKISRVQRIAHLLHQVQVVVQVVDGGQHGAEHFDAAVQVVHIGAAETTSATLFP